VIPPLLSFSQFSFKQIISPLCSAACVSAHKNQTALEVWKGQAAIGLHIVTENFQW